VWLLLNNKITAMKINHIMEVMPEQVERFNLHQCLIEQGKDILAVRRGQKLIRKQDEFDGALYVYSGRIKIVQDAGKPRETILWIAKAGDIIGLEEILTAQTFSYDAIAMTPDVNGTFISHGRMISILEDTPFISMTIARILGSRLDMMEDRLTSIAGKRIEKHFAELLIELIASDLESVTNGRQPGYTIKDMAALMGTSKAYLYKVIAHFVKRGIVEVKSKKLEIKDAATLKRIASGEIV
jgi:CRP-like cAMP-binding protein